MKYKLINSNYDKNSGISIATIATNEGLFTGQSKLLDCDKDIESSFAGCEYAEIKAELKYLRYKRKLIKNQLKGLNDFYKNICKSKKFNEKGFEATRLRHRMEELANQIKELTAFIKTGEENFLKYVEQREKIVKRQK